MTLVKTSCFLILTLIAATTVAQSRLPDNIIVTGQRAPVSAHSQSVSVSRLDAATIAAGGHSHINELASQVPGTWISRGSGQESLTAIRSPVLTGPGSCGAFLVLEDGVPIRPTGFCNVNELFEINTAQAGAIEIARGPVSAVWGANALHGAINVLMDRPQEDSLTLGAGPDDYYRGRLSTSLPLDGRVLLNVDHDGGFRQDSGFDQAKLNLFLGAPDQPRIRFSATRLQQETAGFLPGVNAYRDRSRRLQNPNPEAYRDADAVRLAIDWQGPLQLTTYLRHSRMQFLQHFLPGQPVEKNQQDSIGIIASRATSRGQWQLRSGVDAELARGQLRETQDRPTTGSAFLVETRPAGTHYDYQVDSAALGVWFSGLRPLTDRLSLQLAARLETLGYDYTNNASTGNLRDDGSACGFGGCLYRRPADRRDRFNNFSPRIAVVGQLSPSISWWAQHSTGFRPPQATELYRLQRNQASAQLKSERLHNNEVGLRFFGKRLDAEATAFLMHKDNYIFRDANGLNVSDGKTKHRGIELSLNFSLTPALSLSVDASRSSHRYDFSRDVSGGEQIRSGAEIDTAPATLANSRLTWNSNGGLTIELEWLHTGNYAMDAANTVRYPGHDLLNLRINWPLTTGWSVHARLNNLGDTLYAERADFAFGSERFFPGRERSVYLDFRYQSVAKNRDGS